MKTGRSGEQQPNADSLRIVKHCIQYVLEKVNSEVNMKSKGREAKEATTLAAAEAAYGFDQESAGFEGSRVEGRKWADGGIDQIKERGSREE